MPRIPVIGLNEAAPKVREMFDGFMRSRGNIPNMFRTLAHRPDISLTASAHMDAIMKNGTVDPALKELAVVRVSGKNRCAY